MAMKSRNDSESHGKDSERKVVPFRKFRKQGEAVATPIPDRVPDAETITAIYNSIPKYNLPSKIGNTKVSTVTGSKEALARSANEEDPPFAVDEGDKSTEDDRILCQTVNKGLSEWLRAFSGIRVQRYKVCMLDEKDTRMRKRRKSHVARIRRKQSRTEDRILCDEWKPRIGTLGWSGSRPPTVRQLIATRYRRAWNTEPYRFITANLRRLKDQRVVKDLAKYYEYDIYDELPERRKVPVQQFHKHYTECFPTKNTGPDYVYYVNEYMRYQEAMVPTAEKTKTLGRLESYIPVNAAKPNSDKAIYLRWLFEVDKYNPPVDYVPDYITNEDGVLMGSRYEGSKVAFFAPRERYAQRPNVFMDYKWMNFVSAYFAYKLGDLDEKALRLYGKSLWCGNPSEIYSDVEEDELPLSLRDNSPILALPLLQAQESLSVEDKKEIDDALAEWEEEQDDESLESNYSSGPTYEEILTAGKHASGHSHNEVFRVSLARGWKKLSNQIIVPESYDEQLGRNIIESSDVIHLDELHKGNPKTSQPELKFG